jgi:hypothetical protein
MNALKSGINAQLPLLPGEDPAALQTPPTSITPSGVPPRPSSATSRYPRPHDLAAAPSGPRRRRIWTSCTGNARAPSRRNTRWARAPELPIGSSSAYRAASMPASARSPSRNPLKRKHLQAIGFIARICAGACPLRCPTHEPCRIRPGCQRLSKRRQNVLHPVVPPETGGSWRRYAHPSITDGLMTEN